MLLRLAADAVLIGHLLFILFVVFGGALAFRWRWVALLHLPAAAWGFCIEISGRICPLTYLENQLRRAAGQAGYSESFIEHYLLPIIYPQSLTTDIQYLLAGAVLLTNTVIYSRILSRNRQHTK
ncbi:hypothetical protein A1359_20510 [Methylomonas lenta]|uniref:DUF2784 domain-containing protein n=1 Tax=Methylomonas lenta TaxID=980561 RepID=A0A177NTF1_9GAMM|nr:DUF2784 domain-containing protein [Methylomonas lenta]MDD2738097.1 DUF2784 domain-containing protein [Methylomonas lenta]OAI20814.1 hypothetical protein A1359_20510 [Methylomonas lenta]